MHFQCNQSSCPWSKSGDSWTRGCNIFCALLSDDTKVYLMHDLLPLFEMPVCFWHLLYGVLGQVLIHLSPAYPTAVALEGANLPAYVFEIFQPLT